MATLPTSASETLLGDLTNEGQLFEMRRIAAEIAARNIEGLKLYEPMPEQNRFHLSKSKERVARGSNQCLAGDQLIFDPVTGKKSRIDSINQDFHVLSMNPEDGRLYVKRASKPFVKGYGELFLFRLSNGESIRATMAHRVVDCRGEWVSFGGPLASGRFQLCGVSLPPSISGIFPSTHDEDDRSSLQTTQGFQGGYRLSLRSCDERLPSLKVFGRLRLPSPCDAREHNLSDSRLDGPVGKEARSRSYQVFARHSMCCNAAEIAGRFFDAVSCNGQASPSDLKRLCGTSAEFPRNKEGLQGRVSGAVSRQCQVSDSLFCSSHPRKFRLGKFSPILITSITSLGQGEIWDISVEDWSNYWCAGLISANSGKTLVCAVEVARAVTGQDPLDRYPKENGICYCVGFDGKHIADPMWKKLSKAGAFKMIRDLSTMKWRSYRPWDLSDKLRLAEARPAPPLIPPRMIDFISWEIKKTNQPNMVRLKNGWEIHFYSGNAKPPQGSQIDIGWFDEELASEEWYAEIASRLLFKDGYFMWSATPLAGTERLYHLHERAEREAEENKQPRTVEEFIFLQENNPHISDEQKAAWMEKLTDEDREARVSGDFTRISRVFPEYSSKYHEIPFRLIPLDWTRYIAVDPGRQVCAALFLAIPPPEHVEGKHVFLYDEIYIRDCDSRKFGHAMKVKCQGQDFQEFFIDPHEAPKHDTGSGRTVLDQYAEQLKENGVRSAMNGYGFTLGDMNVESGLDSIRTWLRRIGLQQSAPQSYDPQMKLYDRYSPLRVLADKCPNFIWEIKRYRFKRIKGVVTDKPDQKHNHAIDCLRYLSQAEPEYVTRANHGRNDPPVYAAFKQFMKSQNQGGGGLVLGPGNSFQK